MRIARGELPTIPRRFDRSMSQVEYGPLAQYYELINESCVRYDDHASFVVAVRDEFGASQVDTMVLDVACGPGLLSKRLRARGMRVVGIDLAHPLLLQAVQKRRGLFVRADMRRLPFREKFDVVCCLLHTINYMTTGEDLLAAFGSMASALLPGGLAVVDFIAYNPPSEWRAEWRETIRSGKVKIVCEHHQVPDWTTMIAVDRHTYTVHETGRTWSVSGEDHLRITSAEEMKLFAAAAGLDPLLVCGKYDLNASPGFDGGVLVAKKPVD